MEAINIFLQKEQDFRMFERKIFGINYWEYVRPIISCIVNSSVSDSSEMFAKNEKSIKKYFVKIKYIKKYFLKKDNYDILIISQPRRVKTEKGYKNNYIDYYIDYLNKDYKIITLEEPTWSSLGVSTKAHDFPIYTQNIYFTDFHELFFMLKKKMYVVLHPKKYKLILKEYKKITHIVNSWYPNKSKSINFKQYFIDSIIRIDSDKKYVKKLLKKLSPKILMLHYMPSIFKQMLINECNKQNIKTIEIQHGTITKIDPLVNKCLDTTKLRNDTKYIFSFGERQVNKYALSIKNTKNVINVGFPFFEEKISTIPENKEKYILIISQSTIGDSMADFTSKLADLPELINYKIVFKYHPNELSKNYKCLNKKNIIQIKNEKTIYDIQINSMLQIGSYSTSLYEGFAMKVPTLIIKTMFGSIESIDVFKNVNKGVYYIENAHDVLKYIKRNDIIPLDKDIKKLWQNNSEINIKKAIKKIIGR